MVQDTSEPRSISSPVQRRERRDAAAHRQRILAAAQRLFAMHGVSQVSMHQIAQAAGVGQGTLYRRYANKGELCKALAHAQHETFAKEVHSWLASDGAILPPMERLAGVLERLLRFVLDGAALLEEIALTEFRNGTCDMSCDPAEPPPGQEQWLDWMHALVGDLLGEAVTRGDIAPLDISFTADTILNALNPMLLHFYHLGRGYTYERILQGLRRLYIEGLSGRKDR